MNNSTLCGRVITGINNIYAVLIENKEYLCRIKGKIFDEEERSYNPIAVGDIVHILQDSHTDNKGWIISRDKRKSYLVRYNKKRRAPQILASNVDILVCVTSAKMPPFRPRFLDRLLISSRAGNIEPVIFLNKFDLKLSEEDEIRLNNYSDIGYKVFYGSAKTGRKIKELGNYINNKISVFAGQSGVGKSSILNALKPGLGLKVGEISQKYNRGAHITNYAQMFKLNDSSNIIDTPGIRELDIYNIESRELIHYFPEFVKLLGKCSYSSCLHIDEPGCIVKEYVKQGKIHSDRYESYLRMYESLKENENRYE
jgi:ribosome biogenesis GTPase / thiamine phosphate phosphatase